jgi:hypothetical protein
MVMAKIEELRKDSALRQTSGNYYKTCHFKMAIKSKGSLNFISAHENK